MSAVKIKAASVMLPAVGNAALADRLQNKVTPLGKAGPYHFQFAVLAEQKRSVGNVKTAPLVSDLADGGIVRRTKEQKRLTYRVCQIL